MSENKKTTNRLNFSWIHNDLEVKETIVYGKGIFAKKNISKGEILTIFGGYILTIEEESLLPNKFRDGGLQISENHVICSMDHVEDTDFFNHSCNPNAGFGGQVSLISMDKIKKGEQITFDYAMCLFSKNKEEHYSFNCKCGDMRCRGSVTSDDWKNKTIQNKYKGYFQKYLEDKIKKFKILL